MSMVAAGAKGETAAELARALHGDLPPLRLHPAMAAQAQELPLGTFQGQQLRLANRLWAQRADKLPLDDFLRTTRTHYGAELAIADLADDATRKSINAWVEEQTSGKIRDLFAPGAIDRDTRLVVANALYFQGLWREPFLEHDTKGRTFKTPTGEIETPTMSLEDEEAEYVKLESLELLTKKYRGNLAMTVLLPKAGTDLAEFERSLTADNLKQWLAARTRPHVQIFLPKFKHETSLDLEPVLAGLGVRKAFTAGQADLTGIRDDGELFLFNWRHRATIEVDEKGTVAAAASGGGGGFFFGGVPEKPRVPIFRADRPFVFLIRDLRTDTILFVGRVVNPAA
jgi:serpin B